MNNTWNEYNPNGLVPKIVCQRFDNNSHRFYHFIHEGKRVSAAGITTWLDRVTPESKYVTLWKIKYGVHWQTVLNLTADYGTTYHAIIAEIIKTGNAPQTMIDVAQEYLKELRAYDSRVKENTIYKDIIAFKKFQKDYDLKPLLVEAVLACQSVTGEYYSMTVDLPATMMSRETVKEQVQVGTYSRGKNKGQPKYKTVTTKKEIQKTILIDFKSNVFSKEDKSFYDSHLFQLIGAQKAMRQNFDIDCVELYNWSPNAWRDTPSYNLYKWDVKATDYQRFEMLERLASLSGYFKPTGKIEEFDLTEQDPDKMLKVFNYEEYLNYIEARRELAEKMSEGFVDTIENISHNGTFPYPKQETDVNV